MTTEQHPITPPSPELVEQIRRDALHGSKDQLDYELRMIHIAFRSGADQELEACIDVILAHPGLEHPELLVEVLRDVRRPKPPSLAEQALAELDQIPTHDNEGRTVGGDVSIIRRALERLKELESNG